MCLSYYFRCSITAFIFSGLLVSYRAQYSVLHVRFNSVETVPDSCHRQRQRVHHRHVSAPSPPDIRGHWTSQRCEVRSGPEFLVRKYKFLGSSAFELRQYHYADSDCSVPIFCVAASGSYSPAQASWAVPGAHDMDYRLSHVAVMPYDNNVAARLQHRVNRTCPGLLKHTWEAFERYTLLTVVSSQFKDVDLQDTDCTAALGLTFHELQLMRLEIRRHHRRSRPLRRLYLGSVPTNPRDRLLLRPTAYQEALSESKDHSCSTCRVIANCNDYYPPQFQKKRKLRKPDMRGEWFSDRCELRPNGMYLTRQLLFSPNNKSWSGVYNYFADALCREATFSLNAGGTYIIGSRSLLIRGSYHCDFLVTTIKITPHDKQVVDNLNRLDDDSCGKAKSWRQHVQQDVTITKGCRSLGIHIPLTEYELVKIDTVRHESLLYLGERPSDGSFLDSPDKRPTSFQPSLVQCDTSKPPLAYSLYRVQKEAGSSCGTTLPSEYVIAKTITVYLAVCAFTIF